MPQRMEKINNMKQEEEKKMEKIDQLDRKILRILSDNARVPFKEIAARCGVSRAAVHQRVQRLIDNNVFMGSGFDINPTRLGYPLYAYVGVHLEHGKLYHQVVEGLKAIPEVVECHCVTGRYAMLLKLYARDNAHLMALLNTQVQAIAGVVSTETLVNLEASIQRELPIHMENEK